MVSTVLLLFTSAAVSPETLIDLGHWKRARAAVEPALRSNPNDARLLWLMSRIKMAFDDLDSAQQLAERSVALDGSKSEYHGQLAQVYGRQAQRAVVFKQFGLARKAKRSVETAVALDPKNVDALIFLTGYLTKAPGIIGGDKNRAQRIVSEMWKFDPVHAAAAEAILAEDQKQWDRVKAAYERAVQLATDRADAHINVASIYLRPRFKDAMLAEKHAREAQRLAPEKVVPYGMLAALYARQKRWNELDNTLAEAGRMIPDNASPYFSAATSLIDEKQEPARAEAYLRRYIQQEPEAYSPPHAVARWKLGLALEQQGKKEDAVREIQAAIQQQPELDEPKKDLKRLRG
jgi:tetratricopeptide (TPR) repeat protein